MALKLQKIILQSNSSRLFSIRQVTQFCINKKLSGVDGKTSLTFSDRFELNEVLKVKLNTWLPQSLKNVTVLRNNGSSENFQISTISDRVWQTLINLAVQPAHEAIFHPRNFGFRNVYSIYHVQKTILCNLNNSSFGDQKRVLKLDLSEKIFQYSKSFLLENILLLRSIKFSLNRFLSRNVILQFFSQENISFGIINLFFNVLLHGIEDIHECVRFGSSVLFFLKPKDDEKFLYNSVVSFLLIRGFNLEDIYFKAFLSFDGFDFLGWHFRVCMGNGNEIISTPSDTDFQEFLFRIKRIINNSNYGSAIKVSKLYPIVKKWRLYHKFTSLKGSKFSLFFMKRRAFKSFSKEARQDFFSTKRLVNKCFYTLSSLDKATLNDKYQTLDYYGHLFFVAYLYDSNSISCRCIHCGMRLVSRI